ncbi:arylesterase/monooxygenase [Cadophora sp. MPI-SDFR-AT-0126]|nr:arylesterase/monooxygenase [Leotiomycetes sp. MPI-SDFR-AT-0126]
MSLQLDPEYRKTIEPLIAMISGAPRLAAHDITSRRAGFEAGMGALLGSIPAVDDVEQIHHKTIAKDGHSVSIYQFEKKATRSKPGPAILHCHGGGMILGSVKVFASMLKTLASKTGVPIFSVDYRLAPEHPHPTPVEDCYAGLIWLQQHAVDLNIDKSRIAIMGESAGGGIAAGVALMARDRAFSPPLAKQILVYPMLDDRNITANPTVDSINIWSSVDNLTGWTALLGDMAGKDGVSPYAAPARAESVKGLPPTYVDVGQLDLFLLENMEFISRLVAENIVTEFHLYPGVPHGFEGLSPESSVSKRAMEHRLKAMTSF